MDRIDIYIEEEREYICAVCFGPCVGDSLLYLSNLSNLSVIVYKILLIL